METDSAAADEKTIMYQSLDALPDVIVEIDDGVIVGVHMHADVEITQALEAAIVRTVGIEWGAWIFLGEWVRRHVDSILDEAHPVMMAHVWLSRWQPTHRLTLAPADGAPQSVEIVRLESGDDTFAYTRDEFENETFPPAWEHVDGQWYRGGKVFGPDALSVECLASW